MGFSCLGDTTLHIPKTNTECYAQISALQLHVDGSTAVTSAKQTPAWLCQWSEAL